MLKQLSRAVYRLRAAQVETNTSLCVCVCARIFLDILMAAAVELMKVS